MREPNSVDGAKSPLVLLYCCDRLEAMACIGAPSPCTSAALSGGGVGDGRRGGGGVLLPGRRSES